MFSVASCKQFQDLNFHLHVYIIYRAIGLFNFSLRICVCECVFCFPSMRLERLDWVSEWVVSGLHVWASSGPLITHQMGRVGRLYCCHSALAGWVAWCPLHYCAAPPSSSVAPQSKGLLPAPPSYLAVPSPAFPTRVVKKGVKSEHKMFVQLKFMHWGREYLLTAMTDAMLQNQWQEKISRLGLKGGGPPWAWKTVATWNHTEGG